LQNWQPQPAPVIQIEQPQQPLVQVMGTLSQTLCTAMQSSNAVLLQGMQEQSHAQMLQLIQLMAQMSTRNTSAGSASGSGAGSASSTDTRGGMSEHDFNQAMQAWIARNQRQPENEEPTEETLCM